MVKQDILGDLIMNDLISVIIPAYNAEKHIKRCLDSIVNQTYKKLQIIVINDGSLDNTERILKSYSQKDGRLTIVNQQNTGVSQARNNGISVATGKYICFVDSDDYVKTDMIEKLYTHLSKSELCVCGFVNKYYDKEVEGPSPFNTGGIKSRNEYLKTMSGYLYSVYFGALWNKLYLTDIIRDKKIIFRKEISLAEDFIFNLEYLEYVKNISVICEDLYFYYQEAEGSLTKIKDVWYLWDMALIRYTYCIEQYKKMNMYDKCYANIYTALAYELIGPTYDITKEHYKGYKEAKSCLKELYSKKISRDAIKNMKQPQMVHRIAKTCLKLNNYGLFVLMMRIWIKVQRYDSYGM